MLSRHPIIKIPVSVGRFEDVSGETMRMVKSGQRGYVCVANVHMLTAARTDTRMSEVMERARIVTADGMPLVWVLKLGGFSSAERAAGPDLMIRLCQLAQEESIPVFFFGGRGDTINRLKAKIEEDFPRLRPVGFEAPPMLPDYPPVDEEVVECIKSSGARLVFVGLGCPKQEFWMAEYSKHLPAILIGVGAAFDFLAGTKSRAPVVLQRAGLEWFYRLINEPKRLWKRYLYANTLFLWYLIRDILIK